MTGYVSKKLLGAARLPDTPSARAYLDKVLDDDDDDDTQVYKKPWVDLTDEDIALIDWESLVTKKDCARAIGAMLKEKNYG